jgi:hypothetical protein
MQSRMISKKKLNERSFLTSNTKKIKINSYQRATSMSLTARKFYGWQEKKRIMTENDETILSGMGSIKRYKQTQMTLSGSIGAL